MIEVKIADPNVWRAKSNLVWEAAHGPIPRNHVIIFANQNREDFTLENLILVSRRELARLNQNHLIYKNAELTKSGVALAKLISKMHERSA